MMVCQFQGVPARAASNRVLDNEKSSTSTAWVCKRVRHCLLGSRSKPGSQFLLIHPYLTLQACLLIALSREWKRLFRKIQKEALSFIFFFFFLVLEVFLPILSDQGCLLQNSFLIWQDRPWIYKTHWKLNVFSILKPRSQGWTEVWAWLRLG